MSLHLPVMAQLMQFKQEAQIKLQQHSCKAELMYTPDRMSWFRYWMCGKPYLLLLHNRYVPRLLLVGIKMIS